MASKAANDLHFDPRSNVYSTLKDLIINGWIVSFPVDLLAQRKGFRGTIQSLAVQDFSSTVGMPVRVWNVRCITSLFWI